MKRLFSFVLMLQLASVCFSQSMTIHYKNGQNVKFNLGSIDFIDFQEESDGGTTVSEDEAVDLGLSVLWASYNVGATSPEEYGEKFAWGETNTKEKFNRDTYIYYDSDTQSYLDIGMDIGGTDFDVAHVKWGGGWRIPTYEELKELKVKCTWEWSKVGGVNGYIVKGSNGNSIFFPVGNNTINLWGSNISENDMGGKKGWASGICFNNTSNNFANCGFERQMGNYIRPVCSIRDDKNNANIDGISSDGSEYFEITINGEKINADSWGGSVLLNLAEKNVNGAKMIPYGSNTDMIRPSDGRAYQFDVFVGYVEGDWFGKGHPKAVGSYDVISSEGQYTISNYSDNLGMVVRGGGSNNGPSDFIVKSGSMKITKVSKASSDAKNVPDKSELYATEGNFDFILHDKRYDEDITMSGKFRLIY